MRCLCEGEGRERDVPGAGRQCDKGDGGGGGGGAPGGRRDTHSGGVRALTVMLSDRGRGGGGGGSACQTTPRGLNSVALWCWVVITVVACANGAQGEDLA